MVHLTPGCREETLDIASRVILKVIVEKLAIHCYQYLSNLIRGKAYIYSFIFVKFWWQQSLSDLLKFIFLLFFNKSKLKDINWEKGRLNHLVFERKILDFAIKTFIDLKKLNKILQILRPTDLTHYCLKGHFWPQINCIFN